MMKKLVLLLTPFILIARNNQQNLFNVLGSMYIAVLFLGINNCSSVLHYVATERAVMYRERFAGMYSSLAFSLAQVKNSRKLIELFPVVVN